MYLVTTEDDDGIWLDDPEGFDTEREAREFASQRGNPPKGTCIAIYSCEMLTTLESTPANGEQA